MIVCAECGTVLITDCWICGAPICCPQCCRVATEEQFQELLKKKNENTICACDPNG